MEPDLKNSESPETFEQVEHIARLLNYLKPEEYTDREYGSMYWGSACGLAAMILLILPNIESLVLIGCDCRGYVLRDPVMVGAAAALAPSGQQVRLRSLRRVYASGCVGSYDPGCSPWGLLVLRSIDVIECHHVSTPRFIKPTLQRSDNGALWQYARNWQGVCHLTSLSVRSNGLDCTAFYQLFEYMPNLKRLIYRCIHFTCTRDTHDFGRPDRGVHVERLGRAIQALCGSLEELVLEVNDLQDLWGHSLYRDWDREEDSDFTMSEGDSDECGSDESDFGETDNETEVRHDVGTLQYLHFPDDVNELEEVPQSQSQRGPISHDLSDDNTLDTNSKDFPSRGREPSWYDDCPTFLGSLTAFKNLKTIRVPGLTLQGHGVLQWSGGITKVHSNWNRGPKMKQQLKDLLPRSLEHLTLFRLHGENTMLEADIVDVWNEKNSRFPNLISAKQQEKPCCQASEDEEQFWKYCIP